MVVELELLADIVEHCANTQNFYILAGEFVQNAKLFEKLYAQIECLLSVLKVYTHVSSKAVERVSCNVADWFFDCLWNNVVEHYTFA